MNTIYRTIKRVMIIAACLPMSIGAVSITLVNNTDQKLTIVPTGKILQPGEQDVQKVGNTYTTLLQAPNGDEIATYTTLVEYNSRPLYVMAIRGRNSQGKIYFERINGFFATKWTITKDTDGSLQVKKIEFV